MATKKGTKKGAAKKAGAKVSKRLIPAKHPLSPAHPLYGRPILDAVRRGDPAELRRVRAAATKHVAEVQAALQKLDAKLKRG